MYYPVCLLAIENDSDREFMKRVYEDHYRLMYAVAKQYIPWDTDDIISDGCVALIDKIPVLRTLECYKLRSYVVNTIKNTALNAIKKANREAGRSVYMDDKNMDFVSDEPDPSENLIRQANSEELMRALETLPRKSRDILELRYFQNLGDREIANLFGISTNSVRVYLGRARTRLHDILTEQRK